MTDPFDELMELKPTHASVLLLDPDDLADRAGRSAGGARRRTNVLTGLVAVTVLAVVGALGVVVFPSVITAASPTPTNQVTTWRASSEPADYGAERVSAVVVYGTSQPDRICVALDFSPPAPCTQSIGVTGVTWAMVPERQTRGTMSWGRVSGALGKFDGTTFAVRETSGMGFEMEAATQSPAPKTSSLLTCDVLLTGVVGSGTEGGLAFDGLAGYWWNGGRLEVVTTGDLGVAVSAVKKKSTEPVCIGVAPPTGPLADLLAAVDRARRARIEGVVAVGVAVDRPGVLEVNVIANVPGLRERIVEVVGTSIPLRITPQLLVLKT